MEKFPDNAVFALPSRQQPAFSERLVGCAIVGICLLTLAGIVLWFGWPLAASILERPQPTAVIRPTIEIVTAVPLQLQISAVTSTPEPTQIPIRVVTVVVRETVIVEQAAPVVVQQAPVVAVPKVASQQVVPQQAPRPQVSNDQRPVAPVQAQPQAETTHKREFVYVCADGLRVTLAELQDWWGGRYSILGERDPVKIKEKALGINGWHENCIRRYE